MRANPGHVPDDARGKRIRGILADGQRFGFDQVSSTAPVGWPADGQGACRWSITGRPHDIKDYEVIG